MRQRILILALWITVSLVMSTYAPAQSLIESAIVKAGLKMSDVRAVTTFYYQNPQPEKLIAVLKVLLTVKEFTSDQVHFSIITHLISTIAHNDKEILAQLVALKDSSVDLQKGALEEMILGAQNFQSPAADSTRHLDYLWAEFFATGKEDSVKKIMNIFNLPPQEIENDVLIAAHWSLGSNAQQHKKIYAIVKAESLKAKGILKEELTKVLETADDI